MAQGGAERQRGSKEAQTCSVSQGIRDASTGRAKQDGAELSAALESPERRLFRPLGNYFAFIATKGLIKRETILRFSLELEIVCLIQLLFFVLLQNGSDTHWVVTLCGGFYSQPSHIFFCYEQTLNHSRRIPQAIPHEAVAQLTRTCTDAT